MQLALHPLIQLLLKRHLLALMVIIALLAACTSASPSAAAEAFARQMIDKAGKTTAKITKIVPGSEKNRRADELWCVETDAMFADGQTPYLLVVWRQGTTWNGLELVDGEYQWDLNGCPR